MADSSAVLHCSLCQAEIPAGANECPACGLPVSRTEPAEEPKAAAQAVTAAPAASGAAPQDAFEVLDKKAAAKDEDGFEIRTRNTMTNALWKVQKKRNTQRMLAITLGVLAIVAVLVFFVFGPKTAQEDYSTPTPAPAPATAPQPAAVAKPNPGPATQRPVGTPPRPAGQRAENAMDPGDE